MTLRERALLHRPPVSLFVGQVEFPSFAFVLNPGVPV